LRALGLSGDVSQLALQQPTGQGLGIVQRKWNVRLLLADGIGCFADRGLAVELR
jgi:hypothetical protein